MSVNSPQLLPTLVLLFSVCLPVLGQSESLVRKNTDEPENGEITGKVVNESGQPLAGASLFVRPAGLMTMSRTTTSDAEGNFRVTSLEPALYLISAFAPGYTSEFSDLNPTKKHYRLGDNARVEMVRGGAITGTVMNAAGEPVIAARVRAIMLRDPKGDGPSLTNFSFNEQQTDDRGIYRIWGLAPGTYLVSAGGSSFSQAFQFNPYDADSPTYAPSSLTRDTAAEINVRSGEDSTIDIRYRGEPGYVVSGTVKTSAQNGPTVNLIPVGGNALPSAVSFQPPGGRGFAFHGVGDGDYDLVAQEATSGQAAIPTFALSDTKRITVKGANVTGIELVPKPLPSLSGRITLEPSKLPDCRGKRPPVFAETLIQLQREEKEAEKDKALFFRVFEISASPDKGGAFVFRNLVPGRYQFDTRFYARYWYLRTITLGSAPAATAAKTQGSKTDAAANWTVVKTGDQLTNLTIILTEGAASIRGKLPLAEGASAPAGAFVFLLPAEHDKGEDVLRFFVTEVAADGTFALNNLPPGKYWTLAQTTNDAQITAAGKLRQPESAAARTKLRRTAETAKSELELKPCQNLADYQLPLKN